MKAVRKFSVEGFALTVCGAAAMGGAGAGAVVNSGAHTAVIAGLTADEQVANAFRAGMKVRREDEPTGDDSINVLSLPSPQLPYLRGDESPQVE